MSRVTTVVLLVLVAFASDASASSITGLTMTNSSSATVESGALGIARSFHSATSIESQSALTFSTRFTFQNSIVVVQPDGPSFALTNGARTEYRLDWMVLADPAEQYRITVEVVSRGSAVARADNAIQFNASPGAFSGRFDPDTTDATDTLDDQLTPLTLFGLGAAANATTPFSVVATDRSSTFDAGVFTGSRAMALRFTSFGSPNSVFGQNNGAGEAAVRWGLDPVDSGVEGAPAFADAFYASANATDDPAGDGHFVTLRLTPVGGTAVPEPSSVALVAAGVVALAAAGRRPRA